MLILQLLAELGEDELALLWLEELVRNEEFGLVHHDWGLLVLLERLGVEGLHSRNLELVLELLQDKVRKDGPVDFCLF